MDQGVVPQIGQTAPPGFIEAWGVVTQQLGQELSKGLYHTWVAPLNPLSYQDRVFRLGAVNTYSRDWVESRLLGRITRLLEGVYHEPIDVKLVVSQSDACATEPLNTPEGLSMNQEAAASPEPGKKPAPIKEGKETREPGSRKVLLHRAYGSERARVIQPERGMFVTQYFFNQWLPLIGHSAFTIILAARSMCYWNPLTGDLRNVIETDMAELARRASVSVRTVKDVLNQDLVKLYFLRYKVRRVMTSNGVRTAGISLVVRMDDPLTPQDQDEYHQLEGEHWYPVDFDEGED